MYAHDTCRSRSFCVCVCMYIYIYIYMHTCIHAYTYTYVFEWLAGYNIARQIVWVISVCLSDTGTARICWSTRFSKDWVRVPSHFRKAIQVLSQSVYLIFLIKHKIWRGLIQSYTPRMFCKGLAQGSLPPPNLHAHNTDLCHHNFAGTPAISYFLKSSVHFDPSGCACFWVM